MEQYNLIDAPDSDIIQMCNEIYEWRHVTGKLPQDSLTQKISKEYILNTRDFEKCIIDEANRRYNNIVKLLFEEKVSLYLK